MGIYTMEDSRDRNMDDLMAAAKLKLEKQKEVEARGNGQLNRDMNIPEPAEDIYADMRNEMEVPEADYPSDSNIRYSPPVYDDVDIDHNADNDTTPNFYMDAQDTPIFDGGPGVAQVDIWKKQFSKEKVMHTQILDRHFVFRTLNRYEYKQIVAIENMDALYREEVICRTCVLWPYNYDFKQMAQEDSGYPSTLAQIIMENSGFTKEYGIEVL